MIDTKNFLEEMTLQVKPLRPTIIAFDRNKDRDKVSVLIGLSLTSVIQGVYKDDPIKEKIYDLTMGKLNRTTRDDSEDFIKQTIIPTLLSYLKYDTCDSSIVKSASFEKSIYSSIEKNERLLKYYFDNREPIPGFDEENTVLDTVIYICVYATDSEYKEDFYDEEKQVFIADVGEIGFIIHSYIRTPDGSGGIKLTNLDEWLDINPPPSNEI